MLEVPNTLIFRKLKFDLMSDSFRVKNTERSSFCELMLTGCPIGPFWKDDATPAVICDAPTITALDKSRSLRTIPGET